MRIVNKLFLFVLLFFSFSMIGFAQSGEINFGNKIIPVGSGGGGNFIVYYDVGDGDFSLKGVFSSSNLNKDYFFTNGIFGYNYSKNGNWLSNNYCSVRVTQINNNKFKLDGNFNASYYNNYIKNNFFNANGFIPTADSTSSTVSENEILKANYYMKTFVYGVLFKQGTGISSGITILPDGIGSFDRYTYNKTNYNTLPGTTLNQLSLVNNELEGFEKVPYVLVEYNESNNIVSFERGLKNTLKKYKELCLEGDTDFCGTYEFVVYTVPIDGKCDFDGDGELKEYSSTSSLGEFVVGNETVGGYTIENIDGIESYFIDSELNVDLLNMFYPIQTGVNLPPRKLFYNETGVYYIDRETLSPVMIEFDLTLVSSSSVGENKIKVVKNGVISYEKVTLKNLSLESSKLKKFKSSLDAKKFVEDSYNLMKVINITKKIETNPVLNQNQIDIVLENLSNRKNITVYQYFPKYVANSVNEINFISDGGGKRFIVDNDPIVGWYFEDGGESTTISYTVNDTNFDGGLVVVSQEPILYNGDNLVINYREVSCNAGEVNLFELDDLIDSAVYSAGSNRLYKVCMEYLGGNGNLGVGSNFVKFFNFTNGGNVSFTSSLTSKTFTSVDNSSLIWDVKISAKSPGSTYSCLGSVSNLDNSLFGDCGYNTENLIWVSLSSDSEPPRVELEVPYLAHLVEPNLLVSEPSGESGISEVSYCIDDDGTCSLANSQFFGNPVYNLKVDLGLVTCANDWSCNKKISYGVLDKAGNMKTGVFDLQIVDKGSSCQADCTSKPSPNRYLKECRNLNSCKYYGFNNLGIFDDGKYVAEQCNFLIEGSYAYYNETHDIKCPNGPFRKSIFTNEFLSLSQSKCNDLVKIPYPIVIGGKQVVMSIVTCFD